MLVIGFTNHYYTLWRVSTVEKYDRLHNSTYQVTKYHFCQNLSMEFEEAKQKMDAMGQAYEIDLDLRGDTPNFWTKRRIDNLQPWQFSFGRLTGADIRSSGDTYQLHRAMTEEKNMRTRYFAKKRLLDMGELIKYSWVEKQYRYRPATPEELTVMAAKIDATVDEYLTNNSGEINYTIDVTHEYCTKRQHQILLKKEAEALISGHFFEDKKRVELKVTKKESFFFETAYGTVFIVKMLTEDGKLVKYKGSSPPYFENPDEYITVTASIEHGEYKGVKETRLKRIKVKNR